MGILLGSLVGLGWLQPFEVFLGWRAAAGAKAGFGKSGDGVLGTGDEGFG